MKKKDNDELERKIKITYKQVHLSSKPGYINTTVQSEILYCSKRKRIEGCNVISFAWGAHDDWRKKRRL